MTNYSLYSDHQLLQLLTTGDESAFEQLYNQYSDGIFKAVMVYTKDLHTAQDIVQSIFLTVWEKRETLGGINSINDYLFIAARNRVLNELKSANRRVVNSSLSMKRLSGLAEDADLHPEEIRDYQRVVQRAVDQLPAQQKKAYLLYSEGGYSYDDIAQSLQVSKFTIKRHLEEARRSVRQYIRGHIPELAILPVLVSSLQKFF